LPGELRKYRANRGWKGVALEMLVGFHAENTNLHHKGFRESLRLHHHGEDEKAHPYSANKRDAFGIAFFNQVVVSWRPVKAGRQSLFW